MKRFFFFNYVVAMVLITIVMLTIYTTAQQNYRSSLNDPQIQIARDLSTQIDQGKPTDTFFKNDPFSITKSLSPFVVLYDSAGKALRSNAFLYGRMPQPPAGVFDVARNNGEYNVSWQPASGIRMAMVIVKTNSSPVHFVASGRSMIEVEARIANMARTIFIAWIICMGIVIVTAIINYFKH